MVRAEMMSILSEAYRHLNRHACFYSANLDRTGHPQLDALPSWDWTPQPARPVEGNTTCLFPLALGCEAIRLADGTLCFDDTLSLLSPEMHREFSLPYLNRVAREAGTLFYHSCSWYERHFDNIRLVSNVRAYNWNPGNSADPRRILREFSGRAVLAPYLCLDMHKTRDTQAWSRFADEVELLAYLLLDGMQDNTTLHFWLGHFETQPYRLWRLYQEFDKCGFSPASFTEGKKPHDFH